jgi:hypothetical protein
VFDTVQCSPVLEVIIDNNGIDPFVDIPGAYEAVLAAIERGDLKIWYGPHDIV